MTMDTIINVVPLNRARTNRRDQLLIDQRIAYQGQLANIMRSHIYSDRYEEIEKELNPPGWVYRLEVDGEILSVVRRNLRQFDPLAYFREIFPKREITAVWEKALDGTWTESQLLPQSREEANGIAD